MHTTDEKQQSQPEQGISPQPGEFRGIWVDSWNPGILTPDQTSETVEIAASSGCNALLVEVRKAADACYQSSYEPWAENVQPGYDPLADVLEKAHARGIEVHAWLVTCRAWKGESAPKSLDHVYHTHPEWMSETFDGAREHEEGYYFDPGVPEAQDHIAKVFVEVAEKYPVDGLHFDYVRYPGKEWGYNPVSVARFQQEYGRTDRPQPNDPDWSNWRRAQVSSLVRKVYVNTMAVRPKTKVSAATITWGTFPKEYSECSAYATTLQDWAAWMEEGILDANVPMNYKREMDVDQAKDFRLWCQAAIKRSHDRHVYMGLGNLVNPVAKTIVQLKKAMSLGSQGVVFFSYKATNNEGVPKEQFFQTLKEKVYKEPAEVPQMPWKSNPTSGIMRGKVMDKITGQPVAHARVWLAGTSLTTVTDGMGFYAFTKVPTGIYSVTVSKSGYATTAQEGTAIVAGSVTTMDIQLSK